MRSIDRSSRGGSEPYLKMKSELASLGVELRDTKGIIQPSVNLLEHRGISFEWSDYSPSRVPEIIEAESSRADRIGILSRTVDTSIFRIESGYKLREAQFGYKTKSIFDSFGKQVVIQIRHDTEGKYIEAIFEKTIEGVMTEQEIVDYVNSLGYLSRERVSWVGKYASRRMVGIKKGKQLEIKQMQKYRKNPIYCGVNIENWGKIKKRRIVTKTKYAGLISISKFNQANKGKVYIEEMPDNKIKVLYDLKLEKIVQKRQKFRTEYVFKNVILCDICKKPFLASPPRNKKGEKFHYYH